MTNEQIIEALGLEQASDEVKHSAVENVRAIVDLRAGGVVGEMMTDEQAEEFGRLQEAGNNEVIWEWLRNEVTQVDMSEVYESTLKDYIAEVIDQQAKF